MYIINRLRAQLMEGLLASFLKNINMVSRSANMFLEQQLESCGIKGHQAKYILVLCRNPGLSQDMLAKILFVNKSNVARQIAALEEDGYVERREATDRRVSLVFPTRKAEEILPVIKDVNARWREVITSGFTDEEKETLLYLTQRLYDSAVAYMEGDR